jgi:DNA-binding transcriptional MerR regulator
MAGSEGYRVPEVCKVVGITYRQLDYWARTELVTPSVREAGGSGTQRLYSFQDLVQLRIIKQLLETGISLQHVRKAIEYLRTLDRPVQSMTLISDGRRVYTPESPEAVIDLLSQGQGVFAIALGKVEDDLSRRLNAEPAGRKRALAGAGGA